VLSYDFALGIPAGVALGLLPAYSQAVAASVASVLLAFGGALVAIAAVVIAVKTIFVTLLSPEYLVAFEHVRGGLKGAARPYVVVAWVCILGAIVSFAAALGWPAIPEHGWWLRWLAFSIPSSLAVWGLLGTAQLIGLGTYHLEQRALLMRAVEEFRRRQRDGSSRSA
jgi:hypothetical protein